MGNRKYDALIAPTRMCYLLKTVKSSAGAEMPKTDVIYAYFVTVDRFNRLEKSISEQIKLGLGIAKGSYLIIDRVPDRLPNVLKDFFGDRIVADDPYVIDEHNNRALSFSKLRNSAIRTARKSDASWMFFCDADTVITKISLPDDGVNYALPYVYWQKTAEETMGESIKEIENKNKDAFSEGNSWFILHRDVFSKLDFNEHIVGYGWEDLEFSIRTQAKGFVPGRCETHIVHLFHTQEERQVHWWQFHRNQAIFEAVQLEIQNGYDPDWSRSEPIATNHPHWATSLYFDYRFNLVVNPLSKNINPFSTVGDTIKIQWNDWPAEVFRRNGTVLEYVRPSEGEEKS